MLNRIMAYRQLGGQAKGVQGWGVHGSHTIVAGGQARTVGGQAKAVGGQARTAKYENKHQVGPLHANKLFPRTSVPGAISAPTSSWVDRRRRLSTTNTIPASLLGRSRALKVSLGTTFVLLARRSTPPPSQD